MPKKITKLTLEQESRFPAARARHKRTVSPAANIQELQLLYRRYLKARKHKAASMVHMRLRELMHRQLKRENREDRRA